MSRLKLATSCTLDDVWGSELGNSKPSFLKLSSQCLSTSMHLCPPTNANMATNLTLTLTLPCSVDTHTPFTNHSLALNLLPLWPDTVCQHIHPGPDPAFDLPIQLLQLDTDSPLQH